MAEKNIVDDYYSNISGKPESDDNKGDKKPAVKAKRKVVIKKPKPVQTAKTSTEKPQTNKPKAYKKPILASEKKEVKQKGIIQNISVVKPSSKPIRKFNTEWNNNQDKTSWSNNRSTSNRPSTSRPSNNRYNKPGSTQNGERKPGQWSGTNPRFNKTEGDNKTNKPAKVYSTPDKKPTKASDNQNKAKKPRPNQFAHKKTRGRVSYGADTDSSFARGNNLNKRKKEEKKVEDIKQNLVERKGETIVLQDFVSLKELSEKFGVVFPRLIAEFMKNGMMVNINSKIDFETACIVAEAFDIKVERDKSAGASVEDVMEGNLAALLAEDNAENLVSRSPVISIMGHVDHGKTSLLDYIRNAKVTAGEAGGITQSIGAYQVEQWDQKITFLDTPGHEAFTIMRARGAKSTDIAILVVAADEWVKPQTIESINHAKEAGIPVVVAINKMDKEGANPDHVKGQLSEHGLVPEDWGGDTPMVPVSAHTGFGIDDILEIILLVAEMQELKANPDRAGVATVLESHLDQKLGPVATILMNAGQLAKWDNIVCQDTFGKVKILKDHFSRNIKNAGPSQPVLIAGLDKVVEWGDILQVVKTPELAKQKAIQFKEIIARNKLKSASGLDLLMSKIKAGNLKQLKIVLKADTNGALEAIKWSLLKLSTEETTVSVIHQGVGSITEWDILMSQGSEALLIGFSVDVLSNAKSLIDSAGVEYIHSDIIYHITERVEKIVTWMLDPKEVEISLGRAKVWGIFYTSKEFMILGLKIKADETIENKAKIRVIRKNKMIGTWVIASLKQGTLEVKDLEWPIECGIRYEWNTVVEQGDELELYKVEIQK